MVNEKASAAVQQSLDSCTGNQENGIAGLVMCSIDRNGDIIQANASGTKGLSNNKPMDLDTVFWIASCTKIITAIACMQQVEQGKLSLDDPQHLYQLCPEIEKARVIQDDGSLKPRKNDITLRMLLAHTAGYGYEFFSPKLRDQGRPIGYDSFSGDIEGIYKMPLVNEPGSDWEYGINLDWAGIALERATGLKLNDYMQQNIFQPLEIDGITMFPSEQMKENLAHMHQRWHNGKAEEREHIYRRALAAETTQQKDRIFNSGGAGCFAKPTDYIQVLVPLLNEGTHPKTGVSILKPATVKAMWENQIPQFPDFGRKGVPAAKSDQTNPIPDMYPQGDAAQGWGLSFFQTIQPSPMTGRGANTAYWAGIANLFWWVDIEKGVAGFMASQMMPFGDPHVFGQWIACEKAIYDSL